jgi:hypothetical protein
MQSPSQMDFEFIFWDDVVEKDPSKFFIVFLRNLQRRSGDYSYFFYVFFQKKRKGINFGTILLRIFFLAVTGNVVFIFKIKK